MAEPLKSPRISIHVTVVLVFAIATILTAILALGLQYYFGYALARDAARDLYANTAKAAARQLISVTAQTANAVDILVEYPQFSNRSLDAAQLQIFATFMQQNPLFYGIYLGFEDGGFRELIHLRGAQYARKTLGASAQDRWVTVTVGSRAGMLTRRYEYLNEKFEVRATRSEPTDFDVRARPWYATAVLSVEAQTTDIYKFSQLGAFGQTVSKRIPQTRTVIGIDMTLWGLSNYLSQQVADSEAISFVFQSDGQVVASSDLKPFAVPMDSAELESDAEAPLTLASPDLIDISRDPYRQDQMVEVVHEGSSHFAYVTPLVARDGTSSYFGVLVPQKAVVGTFLDKVSLSIGITAIFLVLLLPLSWVFASPIVRPIRQLADENEKIRLREFDQVERVDTWVKEVDELSKSMVNMVSSIETHETQQRNLMDSFIQLIAQAIDEKSPYTASHCARVPELALMLAAQASDSNVPPFDDFRLETQEQWREYQIAAWLHDCGKITTPEHIVDKGSKLETIYNRIHEVRMRFEVLWRDAEIRYWEKLQEQPSLESDLRAVLQSERRELLDDFTFVAQCNVGGEFLDDKSLARLKALSGKTWQRNFDDQLGLSPVEELRLSSPSAQCPATEQLLSDKPEHVIPRTHSSDHAPELGIKMEIPEHLYNLGEVYNLSVSRGTLTKEDRFKIQEHMISTIKMLDSLPFPEELKNVPRYASTHHETMRGSGYPRKLQGHELSIPERILAVADVFEALTASDRPYKKAKPVSVAIDILHNMVLDDHIDKDCFELFVRSKVYAKYADQFLDPEQIDTVDESRYVS